MHFYIRPLGLFALFVDFYIDSDRIKLYSLDVYKEELILDLFFVRIVYTPKCRLIKEKEYEHSNQEESNIVYIAQRR